MNTSHYDLKLILNIRIPVMCSTDDDILECGLLQLVTIKFCFPVYPVASLKGVYFSNIVGALSCTVPSAHHRRVKQDESVAVCSLMFKHFFQGDITIENQDT